MKISAPKSLTPTRFRIILSATLVITILAAFGMFYYAYNKLSVAAAETGAQAASARESEETLAQLESLRQDLDERLSDINRVSNVMANSQNYSYQDRLVNDLTVYAQRANLTIRNISFSAGAATPAPVASGDTTGDASETTAPSTGLKSATVDVTLESPVNYRDLLTFLHYVEQNLTKMKVSKVVLSQSESGSVTTDVLNLEVYLR